MGYMFHLMLSTLVVKYSPKSQGKKLLLVIKCQFYFMYFRAQWKKKQWLIKHVQLKILCNFLHILELKLSYKSTLDLTIYMCTVYMVLVLSKFMKI